jgi:hypothetical protein
MHGCLDAFCQCLLTVTEKIFRGFKEKIIPENKITNNTADTKKIICSGLQRQNVLCKGPRSNLQSDFVDSDITSKRFNGILN